MSWGEQVTRRRRVQDGEDRYGNPTYVAVETVLDEGAGFDPGGSREPVEVGRASVVTEPKLYFRTAVDVVADDEVIVRGDVYRVAGRPARWASPFAADVGGLVVELERVEG